MNLASLLGSQVEARPDAPAIIDRHAGRVRTTTFADLERQSQQGAALLRASGLRAGDRVLLLHRMSAELYVALVAALRAGMVTVVVDVSMDRDDLRRCCARARPAAFIGSPKAHLLRIVSSSVRRIPRHFSLGGSCPGAVAWSSAASMPPDGTMTDVDHRSPALLTFTSGSTGSPKAAIRTHGFLRAQYEALQDVLRLEPGEVDLTTLPIVMLANLASGVTSVIPDADLRRPGSIDPGPVLAQLDRHHVRRVAGSPALLERLVDCCLANRRMLPALEKVFTGGGPVFPGLLDRLQRVAPQADVRAVYGSSEAEPIAHVANAEISDEDRRQMASGRGLLAGAPVAQLQLRIVQDIAGKPVPRLTTSGFEELCLPSGRIGEIVVSGRHVLSGYLDGDGDADAKIRVGNAVWHRTGDAGSLDERGRLWLLGRCSAKVDDAQGAIYPFAVECAAQQHANVRRAALVSKAGRRLLVLELRDRRVPTDLRALRDRLAWTRVDSICEYPRLPTDRRHNAKIDYGALQRLLDRVEPLGG